MFFLAAEVFCPGQIWRLCLIGSGVIGVGSPLVLTASSRPGKFLKNAWIKTLTSVTFSCTLKTNGNKKIFFRTRK
jgi:hypothetical protein